VHTYVLNPPYITRSFRPLDLGGGLTANVCDRAFGYDSSRVELLFTAADQSTLSSVSYRLQSPLTFFNDAEKLNDGFLIGGTNYYSSQSLPCLFKTSLTGAVQWYKYIDNFGTFDQDQVIRILPRGPDFSLYSYPGGTYDDHVYRVEGEATGTTFSGTRISAAAQFRVYNALPTTDPMKHLVCGTGRPDAAPDHLQAMLFMNDPGSVNWMKYYELGGDFTQEFYGLTATADGNYVVSGYATLGSAFFGVLMKIDPAGTIIWCRKLEDISTGLFLADVHELPGGDLLVCGSNANYLGILAKLDPNGQPLWSKLYIDDRFARFAMSGSTVLVNGAFTRIELDANGEGCGFTDNANLTASILDPPVTTLAATVTAFTPSTSPLIHHPRTPELGWAPTCTFSGIAEGSSPGSELVAFPDPTTGPVRLSGSDRLPGAAYRVLSASGRMVLQGRYANGVDLSVLSPGLYVIELPELRERIRVVRE